MARKAFYIEGLKELDAALVGLSEEFSLRNSKNVLRAALKDGGQLVAEAESANAPVGETGELAGSPIVSSKLTRRQRRRHKKESAIETFVGPTPHPKSVQTEFGNAHQQPQPHLRPAFDGKWRAVLDTIIDRTKDRLEKTRRRLARKAERAAAKMKAGA